MSIRRLWASPRSIIYLLSHALAFLVGVVLCFLDSVFLKAVGTSLVAAGVTGWLIFAYVLFTERTSDRLRVLTELGLVNAFPARSARIKPEYDARVSSAREHIDVMGFGLRTLREDYSNEFDKWQRRAHVRILLLDPDFPTREQSYSCQRDEEEQNSDGTIRRDVLAFRDATKHLITLDGPNRFEIRLYKCLPSINIFRVDDELFWGPYLVREQSRNLPTFVVSNGGTLFPRIVAHFEEIWKDPDLSRPLEDLR